MSYRGKIFIDGVIATHWFTTIKSSLLGCNGRVCCSLYD